MKKIAYVLLAGMALILGASSADARWHDRGWHDRGWDRGWDNTRGSGWITLYSAPYFQGHSITLYDSEGNLDRYGFGDRAQSIRTRGAWTLCSGKYFEDDCVTLYGDVEDLSAYDMKRRTSSVRPGSNW